MNKKILSKIYKICLCTSLFVCGYNIAFASHVPQSPGKNVVKILQVTTNYKGGEYKGFFLNEKPHGLGKIVYENGDCYYGEWENGKFNGYGEMTYKNGDCYCGEWENGKFNGYGEMTYKNGDCHNDQFRITHANYIYEGEIKNKQPHGRGICYARTGGFFEGHFENGVLVNGIRILFNDLDFIQSDGKSNCMGDAANYYYGKEEDGNCRYTGWMKTTVPYGLGEINYEDGSIYVGSFKDGKPNGYGVLKGKWKDGQCNGHGRYC